ncbi:MAG: glycosyltransferase family 4 protein [Nocardioidaceae bacterium]|nr:glycosyltransferase family 4 protein [Nocardioidaceae bacterium]
MRADVLDAVVTPALAAGVQSPLVRDAYAARLRVADRQLARGRHAAAAASYDAALRIAFHRVLHFDAGTSPLADDPAGYTEPLRSSAVAQAVAAPRGRDATVVGPRGDGDVRLTIATVRNADFLPEVRAHFADRPGYETRFVDVFETDVVDGKAVLRATGPLIGRVLAGEPPVDAAAEAGLRTLVDGADVLFVEWCTALAVLVGAVDTRGTRVVVRVHAFEPFTRWPQLVDFSRVDDVVFVSDHLRDLTVAAVPGLSGAYAPRLHVIANAMDLRSRVRPKPDDSRFTLALIGAGKVVKDPRWAVEVLRRLRETDERYRLLLVGSAFQDDKSPAEVEYAAALRADLAELGDAVEVVPFTDDVPAVLERVGVVLSTSSRESFHVGLVEGAASGAVPVVRDWPFFPGAAARLFGDDWVVGSPEEAARRVLDLTADDGTWRRAGADASARVVDRWDWTTVSREFERLLVPLPGAGQVADGTSEA